MIKNIDYSKKQLINKGWKLEKIDKSDISNIYYFNGTNYQQLTLYPLEFGFDFDVMFTIEDANNYNSVQLEDNVLDVYRQMKGINDIDWNSNNFYADLNNDRQLTEDERVVMSTITMYTNFNQVTDLELSATQKDGLTVGFVLNYLEQYISSFTEDFADVTFDAMTNVYLTFEFALA